MPKVFIPQIPNKRDPATNDWVPTIDVRPAEEFGDVEILFPSNAPFFATNDLLKSISQKMASYSFDEGDCVIAVGDPSLIAAVTGWLAANKGKMCLLKWDRKMQRYHKIKFHF